MVVMCELSSHIADIVSAFMQAEAPAIMAKVLLTQDAAIILHYRHKQINDIVGASLRIHAVEIVRITIAEQVYDLVGTSLIAQAADIVRSIVVEQADDVVKELVDLHLSATPIEWVFNDMIKKVSTVAQKEILNHNRRQNLVPGVPEEIAMVGGVPAPSSPPSSNGDPEDPPPSSPRDIRLGHHDYYRRSSSQ